VEPGPRLYAQSAGSDDLMIVNDAGQNNFNFRFNDGLGGLGGGPGNPLILGLASADAATLSNIQEDINVMSRILSKVVERDGVKGPQAEAMGIALSKIGYLGGMHHSQNSYIEGFGALFVLNVPFPLLAPAPKEEPKAEKAPDSTWEQTKRELYGPREYKPDAGFFPPRQATVEYDAERVEALKKNLTLALKNAANIRCLKSDEWVAIAVFGSDNGPRARMLRGDKRAARMVMDSTPGAPGSVAMIRSDERPRETVLNLRAKKTDAEAFAKGKLSPEEFQKKVTVSIY